MTFKEIRKQKGLTQEDISTEIGIGRSTISKWEIGTNKPTIDKLSQLAALLGITEGEVIQAISASKSESKVAEIAE
ncbi:MAG: helix-turn-helix transcriptional regulator [Defluviitaleaceae bacterium]|nr:helix-turn-helix transcriptional regulator [Defluviitaleaceae bacterium]